MRKTRLIESKGFVNATASIIAILIGLLFGYVVLLITNPANATKGLFVILEGGFGGQAKGVGQVLYFATPIIMTGLSVGFAFKTGLFNIGASGQFTIGAFVAVYIGIKWTFLPGASHWIVALLCAMAAGAVWALIPGLFKALLNVNEVISCIMMNYIGMYLVNYLVMRPGIYDSTKAQNVNVASSAVLPTAGLDNIFYNQKGNLTDPSSVNIGIFIAIAMAVLMYFILNKTTFGYELKACGHNRHASRYAGINEKRSIILSMVIAGALAALGGAMIYLATAGGKHLKPVDELAAEGFNGIPIALLGLSNPIGIVFSGLFISYITQGGFYLQSLGYVPQAISIIIGVIIYFSALSLAFRQFVTRLFGGKKKEPAAVPDTPPDIDAIESGKENEA